MKQISLIGIGMNGFSTMTAEAFAAVQDAELLIGANRVLSCFEALQKPKLACYEASAVAEQIAACPYEKIAVLFSGDCAVFSGAQRLLPMLKEYRTALYPGISSPAYLCAKCGILPGTNALHMVSLHGRSASIVRNVRTHALTCFLLGGKCSASAVCSRLTEYGLGNLRVWLGENLGLPGERLQGGTAQELRGVSAGELAVLLVEQPFPEPAVRSYLPDSEFVRGAAPMTKAEIRCLSIEKLQIAQNAVCWDMGCGTGSVSVAMALHCPDGAVYAVDRAEEAMELTRKNSIRFGCDQIFPIRGNAEEEAAKLPAADAVFLGGGSEALPAVLKIALQKNPAVRIAATAVSLETLHTLSTAFAEVHLMPEVTQIAVTRTERRGTHNLLRAENPVFLLTGGSV